MDVETLLGRPKSVKIARVVTETKRARTITFNPQVNHQEIRSGQFLMVWIPDEDEIPMSVSLSNSSEIGITVLPVGTATEALASMSVGQYIGIRGPFGTHFSTDVENALVVGGGIGTAPLRLLVYDLLESGSSVTFLIAARTRDDLLFIKEFSKVPKVNLLTSTDDGSHGMKGLATDSVLKILKEATFDKLYTCGPEPMMKDLHTISSQHGIFMEASLERFMKCGCGICGTCALDPTGDLVCVEGPVFTSKMLDAIEEFGHYHRDSTGARTEF
ncbi:MAG: dihydroorotate dehydrogenase electron transfer subunit [Candidatus Thorarchaeota archaeon]|nr:MAG: dihydroorotate dehydrogenase electron transfer subunit [Candidatus Thorarchaeota archaeon]